MKLKKRLRIENATSFKLEYTDDGEVMKSKVFKTYKAMEQFHSRQKHFTYMDYNRYALIDEKWHRFIKLPSPFIFESNLKIINKNFEDFNLQKQNNEECNLQ